MTSKSASLAHWLLMEKAPDIFRFSGWSRQALAAMEARHQAVKWKFFESDAESYLHQQFEFVQESGFCMNFWLNWLRFLEDLPPVWRDAFVMFGLFPNQVEDIVNILRLSPVEWINAYDRYLRPWMLQHGPTQVKQSV